MFHRDVFGAAVEGGLSEDGLEMVVLRIGPTSEINVFQIEGKQEATGQTPIFGRGCTDGFVTDFGQVLSVFFRDPEGLELEVCVGNPDAAPGRINPPGTPAARYHGG